MAIFNKILVFHLLLADFRQVNPYSYQLTRRGWTSKTKKAVSTLVGAAIFVDPANALEKRNEALCGTGFFTNIAQYKCTDIGDISEDGKATDLTNEEKSSVDSLMGKLGLDDEKSSEEDNATQETSVLNDKN